MNILVKKLSEESEYKSLLDTIRKEEKASIPRPARINGIGEGLRPLLVTAMCNDLKSERPILIIVKDEKDMQKMYVALTELDVSCQMYHYRDFVFHDITYSHETEQERVASLSSLLYGGSDVIITTPDACVQYTIPREKLKNTKLTISSSDSIDIDSLVKTLVNGGYIRTEMVDAVGQFSVRGGIVDIFPAGYEYPIRMELFGDDIDSISFFDILSQRRTDSVDSFTILPAKEIIPTIESRKEIKTQLTKLLSKTNDISSKESIRREIASLSAEGDIQFADRFISVIYPEKECLIDYCDKNTKIILFDCNPCIDRIKAYDFQLIETTKSLIEKNLVLSSSADYGKGGNSFISFIDSQPGVFADTFMSSVTNMKFSALYSIVSRQTVSYTDKFDLIADDLLSFGRGNYTCLIMCENSVIVKKLMAFLEEKGIASIEIDMQADDIPSGRVCIGCGSVLPGFELPSIHFVALSTYGTNDGYNRKTTLLKKKKRTRKSAEERILSYADLNVGDYIVHEKYGIGIYEGIESKMIDGIKSDFVKIKYQGSDALFIPCHQLDSISKYIGPGADEGNIKLSKIGGLEWGRAKDRAKKAAREMAQELITLYATREKMPGFACLPDDNMQRDFEKAFPFQETDGQLIAIDEIKKDMEKRRPMDRLLCGDVGFGKTEVAIRAAFKAVVSGKQVAVLVPTTILALQHMQTIAARVRGFPVTVEMLSRFRTPKQQEEIIRKLRRGEIDIIVGTHRIISKDVQFKDLGLVIIDEEQRFGVSAKEKLRQISNCVDTLTLTATPIPRTLNMAMSGIRDMSVLEEAPSDRIPVQTYVLEHDDVIINEAIRKELRRGGQVFYLHNNIDTLDSIAAKINARIPEATIAVAHGRMEKETLSDIWENMLAGNIDILVCTTIIESGVDVPNANTLIVEDADHLGLSQLHQIRGRVGRSTRRSYAYFTFRKGKIVSEIAEKRLSAIKEYTEFGSGFKIALRDLEIRGAGNILGSEQSGHIENVGYDLYMKILNEAVRELKGQYTETKSDCSLDLAISAYIPDTYISDGNQRIDIYKKISRIETVDDNVDIVDELFDRYGQMPPPVIALLDIALIRAVASRAGISKIIRRGTSITIIPDELDLRIWTELISNHKGQLLISVDKKPYVIYKVKSEAEAPDMTLELIKEYESVKERIKESK